jgi:hypothetical protein
MILAVPVAGGVMATDTERDAWLPGLYESQETAELASTLTDDALLEVVADVVNDDRVIVTRADVEKVMHMEVP